MESDGENAAVLAPKPVYTEADQQKAYTDLMADLGGVLDKHAKLGVLTSVHIVNGLVALVVGVARTAPPFSTLRPADAALTRLLACLRETWRINNPLAKTGYNPNSPVGSG